MALIGLLDKRCVVGRAGHSAKTKARRGREIDVLIFPFEGQAAGYSAPSRDTEGKCAELCSLQRLFLFGEKGSEVPSREASGAAGLEVMAAGGVCVKRGGIIATSFTI